MKNNFREVRAAQSKSILLVEDDEDDYFIFCEAIKELPLEIKHAKNGVEALLLLTKTTDIVFLDINMPLMGGFECLTCIRKLSVEIPVIMLSTANSSTIIKQAKLLGASGYLTKPNTIERFKLAIEQALSMDAKNSKTEFFID